MKSIIHLLLILPAFVFAQSDTIVSGVYKWKMPKANNVAEKSNTIFEGSSHDFSWMQMSAQYLHPNGKEIKIKIPKDEEMMLIVKSGAMKVELHNVVKTLILGSVVTILPGDKIAIKNSGDEPCVYYCFRYRKQSTVAVTASAKPVSFITDFNNTIFKAHDKGGSRPFFEKQTAMGKRMEMHMSTLNAGFKSHEPHIHRAEEMVIVFDGETQMQIGQKIMKAEKGEIYFLGSNVLHAIQNMGTAPAMYLAFQFE